MICNSVGIDDMQPTVDDMQRQGVDCTVGAIHESPVNVDFSATLGMIGENGVTPVGTGVPDCP